ncbi:MAG: TldD/PmbA family protein [Myxococcales bacterium]|jgi:PmbA protein
MTNPSMLEIARAAVESAKRKGASEAAAAAGLSREVQVGWRDGKLEKISEATSRGLSLQLYVDGRYSAVSTSDLRPEAVDDFVGKAIALARALAADPYRKLPDPELYQGRAEIDLELEDPGYDKITAEQRRHIAQALEEAARSVPGAEAIVSVTTNFSDGWSETARVASNGFEGMQRNTSYWPIAEVTVRDPDGRRPEEYDYAGACHFGDLPEIAALGRRAAERALQRIGSKKGESATATLAINNRAAGRLVSFLLGPLAASALQQKHSMFEGKLGQQIGSPLLDLSDDPLIVRGLGSRLFDREGIAARRLPVFEAGVLRGYYVDNYYGRKLEMRPTTSGASNLAWKLGDKGQTELLAQMKEGILVTGFLGGNSNGTTGDFSLGIQGFRVRGGQIAEPIAEMNISGNHLELWKRLVAVGNDPFAYSSLRTPTLVFEGVQVAGT